MANPNDFQMVFKVEGSIIKSASLGEIFPEEKNRPDLWLFLVPHDDDAVIGSGLLLQKAVSEKKQIQVLITSDGSQGYCDPHSMQDIINIRVRETRNSFGMLGISEVTWLNFPDCRLNQYIGRWRAKKSDPCRIRHYTGLQNAYTYYLRKLRPARIFVTSQADIHPDHQVVQRELFISIFHATGFIWPELGPPLPWLPKIYEFAVYRDFADRPNIRISGTQEHLRRKLEAIAAYESQKQIEQLVKKIEQDGPVEYFREIDYRFYDPRKYEVFFDPKNEKSKKLKKII
jgi:LmbE family N-acetylglucosaminyl deacetylase